MITVRSRENTDSNSVLVSKNGGGVVGNDHNPMIMEKREKRNNSHHYNGNNYHNYHQNDGGSKHHNQQPTMTILGSNREANNVTVSPQIQQQQHRSKYYNNKSRGGNVGGVKSSNINDVVMLQRPTILAKPQVEIEPQEDRSNKVSNVVVEAKVDRQQTPINVDQQPQVQLLLENKKTRRINEEVKKEVVEPATNPIKSYTETISSRLIGGTQMTSSVRLLDEYLQWQESPLNDYLLDNNNGFLVVGVLGKKGTGKSTLMSQLAASSSVFRAAQSSDPARHCTSGIDAFVTTERTILLDVQPLLSASVLDRAIAVSSEKKTATSNLVGADFKYYENYVELQSLELACFVLAVCNVVIVLEDWFCDPNLLRLLLTAEMLLPNMNTVFAQSKDANKDGCNASLSVTGDELQQHLYEHHPHLVYVLNKTEYVNRFEMSKMKMTLNTLLRESKLLNYRGSLSSTPEPAYSYRSTRPNKKSAANDWENVNLVCLPKSGGNSHVVNDFRGFPGSDKCVKMLLKEILAIKRSNSVFMSPVSSGSNAAAANLAATNRDQIFTEKKWFNFAGKVWEAIRKSPLIAEYNRLMT